MITRYLLKVNCMPTAKNIGYEAHSYYTGKGHYNNTGRSVNDAKWAPYLAAEYGYASEGASKAGKTLADKHYADESAKYGMHTFKTEIVSYEL